jgi:twitching motility protein PilT
MDLNKLLEHAVRAGASDLHLKVGSPPILRVDGDLHPMGDQKRLMQEDTIAMAFGLMSSQQKQVFKEQHEIDLAYAVPGLGRFRCNIFQQRGTVGMVFRVIPIRIPSVRELYLPPVLERLSMEPRGLILVTGTTGSGKSTTLAAMIDYINTHRSAHIVTIEDPIEYLHRDKKCIVNQREIGADTLEFSIALKSALRQDPNIILVGEMRDFETIETALTAAETGHLVFSTLHTVDATETITRIISVFPPYQQQQVRLQLAAVLKGVVSQRLLPRADGKGRLPAVEVMISTALIREAIIEKDKTRSIIDAIESGVSQYGMQSFDQSLMLLLRRNLITEKEALRRCSNPNDFKLKLQGIEMSGDAARADMASVMERGDFMEDVRDIGGDSAGGKKAPAAAVKESDTDDFNFNLDLT